MKNFLIALFSILSIISYGQNTYPATGNVGIGTTTPGYPLSMYGVFSQKDASYTGELLIYHTANNKISFMMYGAGGIGTFLNAGGPAGNTVDCDNQRFLSVIRGAYFASTTSNPAIFTDQGLNQFNYWSASQQRSTFGYIADDGISQVQVKGTTKTDSLKVSGGLTGDVLTKNAAGYAVYQTPSANATSGLLSSAVASLSNLVNCTAYPITNLVNGKWIKVGNTIDMDAEFQIANTNNNTASSFYWVLPVGLRGCSNAYGIGQIASTNNTTIEPYGAWVTGINDSTIKVSWTSKTFSSATNLTVHVKYP